MASIACAQVGKVTLAVEPSAAKTETTAKQTNPKSKVTIRMVKTPPVKI
jgi:hypothetical protein